ncbi:nuclear transport factor 2 family protein, partial [Streptomyces cadmiisoli]|uniref:nuclear transport factor 2 family protein n=1 Tax=Streptomyces cadmiisoli TaxID=2184053 RepID=UPI00365952AF
MGTGASPFFDAETLRRAVEGNPNTLLSLYADDAELRVVDRDAQPSRPRLLHGRDEISALLDDVYSRDMTHRLENCVIQGDHAAFSESWGGGGGGGGRGGAVVAGGDARGGLLARDPGGGGHGGR